MRLTVLGCAGTAPRADSPCSSYLVEADGFRLLLDLGSGALGSVHAHDLAGRIDAVAISHLHGDHWMDLAPYTYVRRFDPGLVDAAPLPVYGPAPLGEALVGVLGDGGRDLVDSAFAIETLVGGSCAIGPFTVRTAPTRHSVPGKAIRVEYGGASITYSGDTGYCDELVGLATGTDLLLCEASFTDGSDEPPGVHLNGGQAGEHASRAGAGRLVLTHFLPWTDRSTVIAAARTAFGGTVAVAAVGSMWEV